MHVPFERVLLPPAPLRPYVSSIVVAARPGDTSTWARLPDTGASLVFCRQSADTSELLAVGPSTRARYKAGPSKPLFVRVGLRAGCARSLLGAALHELADRAVSVDELWGARGARALDELATAEGDVGGVLRTLERLILEGARGERALDGASRVGLLDRATSLLDGGADLAPERVHALAQRLGLSERQLRRLFQDEIGVSPKRYARIARLRRVLSRVGTSSWAQLAAELGFSDQPHLNAEFRELLGVTPRAFVERRFPRVGQCGSIAAPPPRPPEAAAAWPGDGLNSRS
ncbi:helix-turn-helix transcriptional regulator [Sorangium sp. So ce136]|uniref:helix-turn-helix domain-containing protein n=1 Tax=Sorangium sp. So ce136 TaxID=3133284 RepID=UPI003F0EF294